MVPEELPVRELLIMLLGEEGRRKMENMTKTNDQVFSEYYDLIVNTHTAKSLYEAKRLLEKFRAFLGEFPPSTKLAIQFLNQFKDRKLNTRGRYSYVLSAFFRWYSGEKLPIKIRVPKILPQYVPSEDIDRLISVIPVKRSYKKKIVRDVLLVETAKMTGLRRGELASLKVGDLNLQGDDPVLIVRGGKGAKDRAVSLNPYIRGRLAAFVKGKAPHERVFGLAAKTISYKIRQWARKAGVPHLHIHSLRHYVGTTLFQRHANPRAVQVILGHESLEVTMRYADVVGEDTKEAVRLLESDEVISRPVLPELVGEKPKEVLESTVELTVRPAEHDPIASTIPAGICGAFMAELDADRILIESMQVRSSDPSVPYRLMLFEDDPRKYTEDLENEDTIQMKPVKQRIYTYQPNSLVPYANEKKQGKLYGGICVYQRPIPINLLREDKKGERIAYLQRPVHFTVLLRYRLNSP